MYNTKTRKHYNPRKCHQLSKTAKGNCNKNLPGYRSFEQKIPKTKGVDVSNEELVRFLYSIHTSDVNTNNDYYTYMTKHSKKREIPKYINVINQNTLLQDKIYRQCIELVELNKNKHQNLYTFYNTAKKHISLDSAKKYMNEEVAFIDKLRLDTSHNNLWKLLAHFNKMRITATFMPIQSVVRPDEKDITKFTVYLVNTWVSEFKTLHLENPHNKLEYFKHLNYVWSDLLGKNHQLNAEDVLQVHNDISDCQSPSDTRYDYTVLYKNNELTYNFNYEEFFKELGYNEEDIPKSVVIKDTMYLEKICKLLADEWNTDKWRPFWIMCYVRQLIKFTDKLNVYSFNYFLKYNKKWQYNIPNDIQAIRLTFLTFNKLMSELYIEKYNDTNGTEYLTNLINDLKMEFYKIVQNNTWMQPATKKNALLNIANLKIIVGATFNMINDIQVSYTSDPWQNILLFMNEQHKLNLKLYDTNVINIPHIVWDKHPFEYSENNIFIAKIKYDATNNLIYIPSSYIQSPIMDLRSKGVVYNLANIGFYIAKEFNKVLDENGSHYDYNGMLKNWWSDSDKRKYKELKENIMNEYILLAKKDKVKYNITGLEDEIVSFINGFHVCDSYLQTYYSSIALPYIITDSKLSTFYSYFANCHKEQILQFPIPELQPMLSYKYLVNLSLSKNAMFNYKHSIKKGDNMYLDNKQIIW